jgi:hypothetical protein
MGVLSALPLVSAGNLCCCLWVVSGGVVASYLLQQNQPTPINAGDGAIVGLLAGLTGAGIYLILSIPITMLIAPYERMLMEGLMSRAGRTPPEFQQYMGAVGNGVRIVIGFVFMLCAGAVFSTLGGLLGVALFRKPQTPGTGPIDAPAPASAR